MKQSLCFYRFFRTDKPVKFVFQRYQDFYSYGLGNAKCFHVKSCSSMPRDAKSSKN